MNAVDPSLTIVLLPGMDGTGTLFASFAAQLDEAFKVQIVRYPVEGIQSYAALEQHVRSALPSQGRFVILGESFSGPVAISIAASRPAGLVGLVLCATFVRNPMPLLAPLRRFVGAVPVKKVPLSVFNAALVGRSSTPQLRASLAAALAQVPAKALRARMRAVLSVDVSELLQAIGVPVLYLQGQRDRVVPASALEHIRRRLPSTSLQVASFDAPHFLLQTVPVDAAEAVCRFARSLHSGT